MATLTVVAVVALVLAGAAATLTAEIHNAASRRILAALRRDTNP